MEELWGLKLYTTCVKYQYRVKGKNQHGEFKKWLTWRDIVEPETQSTNNY